MLAISSQQDLDDLLDVLVKRPLHCFDHNVQFQATIFYGTPCRIFTLLHACLIEAYAVTSRRQDAKHQT